MIDWPSLHLTDAAAVDRLLRINEYHLDQQRDRDHLLGIHNEAVGYLKGQLRMDLSAELLRLPIPDLFLTASQFKDARLQSMACSVLKAMNIINHINGRELLYHCPISMRDLCSLVEDKIERELSNLARVVLPGIKYEGGRKPKDSLITKLLGKKETIAAQINDRVRYRIVTPRRADVDTVIFKLFETVLPFNYVIPNASTDDLREPFLRLGLRRRINRLLRRDYTGSSYRVVKFAVDIPVRLDRFLNAASHGLRTESLGNIGYVIVEFQVVDEATDRQNNAGENAHPLYKNRQRAGVRRRLGG